MSEQHSPDAIAAYPTYANLEPPMHSLIERQRTAFDRGRVLALTAKREELAAALVGKIVRYPSPFSGGGWFSTALISQEDAEKLTDALLAPGGPLHDKDSLQQRIDNALSLEFKPGAGKEHVINALRETRVSDTGERP